MGKNTEEILANELNEDKKAKTKIPLITEKDILNFDTRRIANAIDAFETGFFEGLSKKKRRANAFIIVSIAIRLLADIINYQATKPEYKQLLNDLIYRVNLDFKVHYHGAKKEGWDLYAFSVVNYLLWAAQSEGNREANDLICLILEGEAQAKMQEEIEAKRENEKTTKTNS